MTAPVMVDHNRVNGLLWRYRPLLDRFEFLLEMQLMVTATGRQDWLRHMADLFEQVAEAISELDLEREVLLPGGLTLSQLAADAPDPWDQMLLEQQAVLESTTTRIAALRERNAQAIEEGAAGIGQLIDSLVARTGAATADAGPSYGHDGRLRHQSGSAILFDGRI